MARMIVSLIHPYAYPLKPPLASELMKKAKESLLTKVETTSNFHSVEVFLLCVPGGCGRV